MLALCAHCLAQPNLEGPLSHADQHYVHYDDSAHDQRNERDRYDRYSNGSGELIDLIVYLFDIDNPEVVILITLQLMPVSHRHTCLFDGRSESLVIKRLSVELKALPPAKHPLVGRQRNVSVVVQ